MERLIFVTGVSTGVGKTYFSYLFLKKLREMKLVGFYFKPVETGGEKPNDYVLCSSVAELSTPPLYHFKNPVSPHLAAKMEGTKIDVRKVKMAIEDLRRRKDIDLALIEGAGGLLVPVTDKYTWGDIIEDMDIPIIVIASSYLGVINHTLMTLEVSENRNIKVIGVVLNFVRSPRSIAERTNEEVLRRLIGRKFLGSIYYKEKELSNSLTRNIINALQKISS